MDQLVYCYDGSFEGFLCCVFESYAKHEVLTAIVSDEDFEPTLYDTRFIQTDRSHSDRVYRKVFSISQDAGRLLRQGFLTCLPQREMHLYQLIRKLLQEGPGFLRTLTDPVLYPILKAIRAMNGEAHLLKGFVRFSDLNGALGSEIEPKNRVLPILRGHFCSRYYNESFFIYDRTHHEVLLYSSGKSIITPLQHFEMAPPDAKEASYRLLWKRFYDTIAIKERENPRCRMTNMPKRYWNTMTEFQEESWFIPQTAPAAEAIPSAPGGISAPEIPSIPGPSELGSTP